MISNYERAIVHPATALWLQENGYSFAHEPVLDRRDSDQVFIGVPDFLAWHDVDRRYLIVECKATPGTMGQVIYQMRRYENALNKPALKVIAVPGDIWTIELYNYFMRFDLFLMALTMPISKQDYDRERSKLAS